MSQHVPAMAIKPSASLAAPTAAVSEDRHGPRRASTSARPLSATFTCTVKGQGGSTRELSVLAVPSFSIEWRGGVLPLNNDKDHHSQHSHLHGQRLPCRLRPPTLRQRAMELVLNSSEQSVSATELVAPNPNL